MNDGAPTKETTIAVVVTYHPEGEFESRFRVIQSQVARVLIVDNGSNSQSLQRLRALCASEPDSIELIENGDNLGIATALNIGCRRALSLGFWWVLSLDQDTVPYPTMMGTLCHVWKSLEDTSKVAALGSYPCDASGRPTLLVPVREGGHIDVRFIMTSGCLLSLAAYSACGPYADEFFIDDVDREYCWRLRRAGYRVVLSTTPSMTHSIANATPIGWYPFRVWTSNHRPVRRYYLMRNSFVVLRRHIWDDPGYLLLVWAMLVYETLKSLLFEPYRLSQLLAITGGLYDGATGRMGKCRRRL